MTVTDHAGESLDAAPVPAPTPDTAVDRDELVEEDVLVEEISIDGMCGVY